MSLDRAIISAALSALCCILLMAASPAMAQQSGQDLLDELDMDIGDTPQDAAPGDGPPSSQDLLDDLDMDLDDSGGGAGGGGDSGGDDLLDDLDMDLDMDTDTDFGPRDGGTKAKSDAGPRSEVLKKFFANFGGELSVRHQHFLEQPASAETEIDKQEDLVETRLEFETWTGGESWRVDTAGWLEIGNQKDMYAGVVEWPEDMDKRRRIFELNELYLTRYFADFDLTLGRKILKNGLSVLHSPANRYSPGEALDPGNPREFGVWQARMDYYLDSMTLTGAVLPVYQAPKSPLPNSRWLGPGGDDYYFRDTLDGDTLADLEDENEVEDDRPDNNAWENCGVFARAKGTLKGWDLFLSLYDGHNPYYVLKKHTETTGIGPLAVEKSTFTKEVVRVFNAATGFSTTKGKWEFHGEALYSYAYSERDDNYLDYVGGFTYTIDDYAKHIGCDQINVTLEYAGEWITGKQQAEGYEQSSESSRPGRNDVLSLVDVKVSEDLNIKFSAAFELTKDGNAQGVQIKKKLREGLHLLLGADIYGGPHDSDFGRWERNKRITSGVTYEF